MSFNKKRFLWLALLAAALIAASYGIRPGQAERHGAPLYVYSAAALPAI